MKGAKMKDETRMKALRVVLIVTGAVFCLAAIGLVVPFSWFRAVGEWFIGGKAMEQYWPDGPLFEYATRVSLVAYLWIGVVLLVASRDPVRHRAQIDIATGALCLMAVVCLVTGLAKGLPLMWPLGDGISALVGAVLLLVLRPRAATA